MLDIAFREDESCVRKDHGAQNLATLRHIALNLLKQEKAAKIGIKNKRLRADWDEQYLFRSKRPSGWSEAKSEWRRKRRPIWSPLRVAGC